MYTVYYYDDWTMDDVKVFEGTLAQCRNYINNDDNNDDLFIVAPDGYSEVE